jgi:hypothetical protein
MNGFEEHAVDRRRLAAAESLARACGVEVAVAYRHLANGTAKGLIESRAPAPRRGSPRPGGLDPKQALLVLWAKRDPAPGGGKRRAEARDNRTTAGRTMDL